MFYWESTYRAAEEYIRSCGLLERNDPHNFRSCADFIHTGYVVNDRGSQILLNFACNKLLSDATNPLACCVP